jgi:hypothetical protein
MINRKNNYKIKNNEKTTTRINRTNNKKIINRLNIVKTTFNRRNNYEKNKQ